ncbi:rhodanese-like domain-containing protein [Candidatus Accumulibacter sp. ACC007]|uniref:rhodanese-like domain-containing protein n=1 Tax=Candidatus Accumulibacter sp. ACC007 TaxID=2823333 RepID=UPI0025C0AAE4|nr:rhodanese-like domain-containing protein [Candidatus Accumulibacter sp. ACC007]
MARIRWGFSSLFILAACSLAAGLPAAEEERSSVAPAVTSSYANEDKDFGVSPVSRPKRAPYHAPTPLQIPGATVVKTVELKHLIDTNPKLVIIDVLNPRTPSRATIPGAVWLPRAGDGDFFTAEKERFAAALQKLTGGETARPLVFLCLNSECWLSYNASLHAIEAGYTQVMWYRGGSEAWAAAGYDMRGMQATSW